MGGDEGTSEEYLHRGPGEAHIYLLLDILIGHGVIHALYADVVVVLDRGHLPDSQFKRLARNRQQEELLILETACPASLPLLEGLMVEGLQFFVNGLIQLWQGEELPIAQGGQNPGRDHAHRALHRGFVLGTAGPGRKNSSPIVLCHFLVGFVENSFGP